MKNKFLIWLIGVSLTSYQSLATPICNCGAEGHESDCCWEFDNGVLTISAAPGVTNAVMKDFGPDKALSGSQLTAAQAQRPWNDISNDVTQIVVSGVSNIGRRAFEYMSQATNIEMDNSVQSIAMYSFNKSGLTDLVIPNSVTTIGEGAFQNMRALQNITLSDSITTISPKAFRQKGDDGNFVSNDSITNISGTAEALQQYLSSKGGLADNANVNCTSGDCAAVLSAWDATHDTNYADTTSISVKQADGSTAVYKNGKMRYEGKRIYTIDEANQVAGEKNTVTIRYK